MTNAIVTDLEVAAIPVAISVINAAKQFLTNLGTDPLLVAAKFPGAVRVFLGQVELSVPTLAANELGAAQTVLNTAMDGWIAKLNAVMSPPAAPTPIVSALKSAS